MKTQVRAHAITRFRERWKNSAHLSDRQVLKRIEEQVREGLRTGDYIKTPGGDYIPFSVDGQDGYIVIGRNKEVITVMPEAYCKEVNALRKKNGATHESNN